MKSSPIRFAATCTVFLVIFTVSAVCSSQQQAANLTLGSKQGATSPDALPSVESTPSQLDRNLDSISEFVTALSTADLIGWDRQGICLFEFKKESSFKRFRNSGKTPIDCTFSEDGQKAFFFYESQIAEIDRSTKTKRVIELAAGIRGHGLVALPKSRFAVLDNRSDSIHIRNSSDKLASGLEIWVESKTQTERNLH